MIIKFLSNGTGDPRLAASYLIGEHDHLGNKRAGVEIVRGDPVVFAAIASSLNFKYCYTSIVINWSPEDDVSDEHINEVTDLVEEHAMAGFSSEQYHMTVVMHTDDDGSRHLHILIPRVELTTGKSMNVAPPGHRHYFDPLRDFLNHKYGWVRPDDPARMKTTKQKNHHVLQNAAAVKAGIQEQPKKTRVEMIDAYIEQRIMFGRINNREELVKSLKEIGEIGQVAHKSISLKYKNTRDRLDGEFYRAGFSFSDYRENRTRRAGIQAVSAKPQNNTAEYSERLTELFERMEAVRRKRAEYNQKYYRAKVYENQTVVRQTAEISYEFRATVSAELSRETDNRHRVNSIPDKNRVAVSRFDEINEEPAANVETVPRRDKRIVAPNHTEQRSVSDRRQRTPKGDISDDGIVQTDEQSISKPRIEVGQAQHNDHESTRRDNSTTRDDTVTTKQNYMGAWDIRRIQYPLFHREIHLNFIGVKNERNTITDTKKSIDFTASTVESSIGTTVADRKREESKSATDHRCTDSINQRTRALAKASAQLARNIEKRELSLEQDIERQRVEAESTRAYVKAVSEGNTERIFIERTNRFFGNIKEQIRNTFRKLIEQLTDRATDRSESRTKIETLSQHFDAVGVDRLVNIARQRTQRRQRIENAKRFKQDVERTRETLTQELTLNIMSAELGRITENFSQLELKNAIGYVLTAERCFHEFRVATEFDEEKDLYLAEYVYSIEECFKALETQLNNLNDGEFDALKKLTTVIESHLGQMQLENIDENGVVYYLSAKREVGYLVVKFMNKLNQQEATWSNNILSTKGVNHSDCFNRSSELNDKNGPEMI